MWATVIIASLLAAVFLVIVVNEIRKKKRGIRSCSCGGGCGSCQLCHRGEQENQTK